MNLATLALRSLRRNRTRTVLTIVAGAVSIVTFILLRTVQGAWTSFTDHAAADRLNTRNRTSFTISLPHRYIDMVRAMPGVRKATYANWFAGLHPRRPREQMISMAVDPESWLEVYDEVVLDPESRERWIKNRTGAIVGDALARDLGLKVGDALSLKSAIWNGDWTFRIDGIYTRNRPSVDRAMFLFHWDYYDQNLPFLKSEVGWIESRIEPNRSTEVSAAIDTMFDSMDPRTSTMTERAARQTFIESMSALLLAVRASSLIVLAIMTMVLGNTLAMTVRERVREMGAMRAVGFLPSHIGKLVIGEALVLGLGCSLVGLCLAVPLIELLLGRWLEENMGRVFPAFHVDALTLIYASIGPALLCALWAVLPARWASRMPVPDALRHVG